MPTVANTLINPDEPLTDSANACLATLADLLKKLKAADRMHKGKAGVSELFTALTEEEWATCKDALFCLLHEVDFTMAFANSGIPQGSSFSDESMRILKDRLLPYLHGPRDARTVIRNTLGDSKDHKVLAALFAHWAQVPQHLSVGEKAELISVFQVQVSNAVKIISYLVAALGMDEDIHLRAGKEEMLITPFMEQNREVNELLTNIEAGNMEKAAEDYAQINVMVRQCQDNILLLDKAAEMNGASLRQTFLLRKLEQLLTRMMKMLPIISQQDPDAAFAELSNLIREVILLETNRRKLRFFLGRNINLLAYRITENKRKTGEHYIAADAKEYWTLFLSACGGGFIVSLLVLIKFFIHSGHMPMLWESLLYSFTYAGGFVAIYMLGFTLATKQPAVTAAYIAASLDDTQQDSSKYEHFAITIARISRSQVVSFAGNLLVVFPCTLLWIFLMGLAMHQSPVNDEAATEFINGIHPAYSLGFLYASIAGVFLFMAGIISGFGDNKAVVSRIGLRLQAQPLLKKWIPEAKLRTFALYIENNMGALMGNIALGFFLGMAGFVGKITGLPFDIRHITFSTGNMALGMYGLSFQIGMSTVIACLTGIVIIGVFNFLVSFVLALEVAARSRSLRLRDHPELLLAVLKYFVKHPGHFLYPPKE